MMIMILIETFVFLQIFFILMYKASVSKVSIPNLKDFFVKAGESK